MTIVCAPAGFGKTIALAGWLHDDGRPSVWVSLDELDSDLASFIRVLASALGAVVPHAGRKALALAAQTENPSPSELSALLADDLAVAGDDLVVVLDDFHVIREPSVHALVLLLIRRLPPTIQLVIAGREEPPLQVALVRRRGELAEVRADDLRFNRAEAMALIRGMGDAPLDLQRVTNAVDRSEGWAVGLRLLSLGGASAASSRTRPTSAAGDHQDVDDYLFDEVLTRQQPELRRFVTRLSILDRFCAPLCEAVMDGARPGDGQRLLDEILVAGLFLTPLDDERRWYRFHHLFRDMLRRCLEPEVGPEGVQALRLRASDWFKGQELWDEAATHAIDANDVNRVTALVESRLMNDRSISTGLMLESWTRRLPPDVVAASPTLSLVHSRMLDIRGEVSSVESEARRIEAMLADGPSRISQALLPIARGQVEAQLGWVFFQKGGDDREARDRFERALDLLPMDQHDLRGGASMLYAVILQCLGRIDDALTWIGTECSLGAALHPDYSARLLIGQMIVEHAAGRLTAVDRTGRRMVSFGEAHRQTLLIGWGHFALGRVAYERNALDIAREHFEAVLALGREAHRLCSVNATLGLAQTLVAEGQPVEAERLVVGEVEQAEEDRNTFLVEDLRSFMARLALASDDLDRAASWLAEGSFTRQGTTGYDIEDQLLTRARVLVARATSGSLDEASAAVDRAIEAAERRHVIASLVQGLALRALVERSRGDRGRAAAAMARSLELGGPEGFTRAFVDLGSPLTELLVELAREGRLPREGRRVLDVCRAESGVPVSSVLSRECVAPTATSALTWREQDVLHLLGAQLTTGEIARLLGIPAQAVQQHAANVYRKLRAEGAGGAMSRAYDLDILRAKERETPSASDRSRPGEDLDSTFPRET